MSVIGLRLKSVREAGGLSLRQFAGKVKQDYTLLARIENGKRYPPRSKRQQFAELLSLTPAQLEALIAVERRGLNPHDLLPEIAPAHIPLKTIESEAERVLQKYRRATNRRVLDIPVAVEEVITQAANLTTVYLDFRKQKTLGFSRNQLCGCLFPDGFDGKDRAVLVNEGRIRGRRLSHEDRRITVAHEAGHYFLHCGNKESAQLFFRFKSEPTFCLRAECEDTLFNGTEYQASAFAACLLMPRQQFITEWQRLAGSECRLASLFGVTETFVGFRRGMLNVNNFDFQTPLTTGQ
jgi:transcriptional regulator with XRE-family HTH domain